MHYIRLSVLIGLLIFNYYPSYAMEPEILQNTELACLLEHQNRQRTGISSKRILQMDRKKSSNIEPASLTEIIVEEMPVIAQIKECSVCLEEKEITNFMVFSCGHSGTCNTCIESLVESALKNSISVLHELKCPEKECKKPFLFKELQQLNIEGLETINELLCDQYIGQQEDIIYCPNQECRCPYVTQKRSCKVTCMQCTTTFCEYCVINHSNVIPCFIARTLWGTSKRWHDLDYLIEHRFMIPCPNCGTYIEKNGGCPHMKCAICKHDFFWSGENKDDDHDWEVRV